MTADYVVWVPPQCRECNETIVAREAMDQRRREAEDLHRRLKNSGLPNVYVTGKRGTADLDKGPDTDGYRVARKVCAKLLSGTAERPWLWLWSEETGTYKTTLAACALVQVLHSGSSGRFVNLSDFFQDVRATYRKDSDESEADLVDPLRLTPWLVLDEMGAEKPSRNSAEILYRLINHRFDRDSDAEPGKRGVIFTSNCSVAEFLGAYANALDSEKAALRLERRIGEMTTEIRITS